MSAVLITFFSSALLCGCYLKLARRWQILDLPNDRSSHHLPTPHGGGVPLFAAFFLGVCLAAWQGAGWQDSYWLLLATSLLLVAVGVIDDLRGLSVRSRFSMYSLLCVLVTIQLIQPQALGLWSHWVLAIMASFALLWMLNLYNFMDGIDGIAGLQCIFVCCAAALLSWLTAGDTQYATFCLLLGAAHTGFLVWNWPPARMFMGDAGSIPTGFLLGGLALLGAVAGQLSLAAWLILLAAFITDASYTLVQRIVTGQPFTRPHRLHAYQRLSRHWGAHLPVDMGLLALNSLWLFPLAWTVTMWPKFAFLLVILAYLPLLVGMAKMRKLG